MFAAIAIALAILSVSFWRKEAELYLAHMRRHHNKRGDLGFLTGALTGLPKLFPLVADIGITISIVALFGLGGGILGAVMGLAMSNTVSFFINREVRKYRTPAPGEPAQCSGEGETPPPSTNPVARGWQAYNDWYWDQVAKAMKRVDAQKEART